jgi:hypothetical protein
MYPIYDSLIYVMNYKIKAHKLQTRSTISNYNSIEQAVHNIAPNEIILGVSMLCGLNLSKTS